MTFLGRGFFYSNSIWTPPVTNAAPMIDTVTLNFDFYINEAPVGDNIGLIFNVPPSNTAPLGQGQAFEFNVVRANAAPTVSLVTLNFDFSLNGAPEGQNQAFEFEVAA